MTKKQEEEILKHLAKASLSLNEASAIAQRGQEFGLLDELVELARRSERMEMKISGEPICRKELK